MSILAIGLPTLVVGAIILSLTFYLTLNNNNNSNNNNSTISSNNNICTTKSCITYADNILKYLDTSVDPCDNFYNFSCGILLQDNHIYSTDVSLFSKLENDLSLAIVDLIMEPISSNDSSSTKKAKQYFNSCYNLTFINKYSEETYFKFLNVEFGGWPLIQNQNGSNQVSSLQKLVKLANYSLNPFIVLNVDSNLENPNFYSITIYSPDGTPKEYYDDQRYVNIYKSYIYRMLQLLKKSQKNFTNEVSNIFELEKRLDLIKSDLSQSANLTKKNVTIKELEKILPQFEWRKFIIDGLFQNVENVTINENEYIYFDDYDYVVKAVNVYADYMSNNKTVFDDYLMWYLTNRLVIDHLPAIYTQVKNELIEMITGSAVAAPRYQFCTNYAKKYFDIPVARMYTKKYFDSNSKTKANEMATYILNEFIDILNETSWMDDTSKKNSIEKAQYIDKKIGYPDYFNNDTYIDSLFKNLNIDEMNFLKNSLNILNFAENEMLKTLRQKRDKKIWQMSPAVVDASYYSQSNEMYFPAGILQPPFYDATVPNYFNYGAIGTVIGHEITHGFDNQGRSFDKYGVYHSDNESGLLTEETIKEYNQRAQCIVDQYGNYTSLKANKSLNGLQTLSENIADNGGIKSAYRAYQSWIKKNGKEPLLPGVKYTQDQLFFISFAQLWCTNVKKESLVYQILTDVHSPGEFRVIGATSNSYDFSNAFNCRPNQNNNPIKKCAVW